MVRGGRAEIALCQSAHTNLTLTPFPVHLCSLFLGDLKYNPSTTEVSSP